MENGSELRDANEALIEHEELLNGNTPTIIGDGSSASSWVEDKILEPDLTADVKPIDYSTCDKKDFVGLLKEAAANNDFKRADELIREIKPMFEDIRQRERTEALIRFKENGGIDEDFYYKGDEWDHAFDIYLRSIRDNRQRHFRELEEQKNTNLLHKRRFFYFMTDTTSYNFFYSAHTLLRMQYTSSMRCICRCCCC